MIKIDKYISDMLTSDKELYIKFITDNIQYNFLKENYKLSYIDLRIIEGAHRFALAPVVKYGDDVLEMATYGVDNIDHLYKELEGKTYILYEMFMLKNSSTVDEFFKPKKMDCIKYSIYFRGYIFNEE